MSSPGRPAPADRSYPAVRPWAVAGRLTATLLVLGGLTVALGLLLTRAGVGHPFERVDSALVRWLAGHRSGVLDALSAAAGQLGNTWVVIGLGIVAAAASVVFSRTWRPALVVALVLGGELAVFLTTTALVDRPRPPVAHVDAHLPPTSSFPSGHTAAAICLYGVVAALVLTATRGRGRVPVVTVAVVLVVLVAASRLYRGAHYPSDIAGSVLFAVPWLYAVLRELPLRAVTAGHGVGEWRA
jgi:membrane-associated phospholipid phosphatase